MPKARGSKQVRKRKIDLERVRSKLYTIALEGADRDAVGAARVLMNHARQSPEDGQVDLDMLEQLKDALAGEPPADDSMPD